MTKEYKKNVIAEMSTHITLFAEVTNVLYFFLHLRNRCHTTINNISTVSTALFWNRQKIYFDKANSIIVTWNHLR